MAEEIKNQENENVESNVKQPTVEELIAQLAQEKAGRIKAENQRDKNATDAADWKKKYRDSLSVQQQAEEANKEAEEQQREYVAGLENFKKKAEAKERYLLQGMDGETAKLAAEAEVIGDYDELARIQKEHTDKLVKEKEAEWFRSRPEAMSGSGNGETTITQEQFNRMGYNARVEFKRKYPDAYKKFTNK